MATKTRQRHCDSANFRQASSLNSGIRGALVISLTWGCQQQHKNWWHMSTERPEALPGSPRGAHIAEIEKEDCSPMVYNSRKVGSSKIFVILLSVLWVDIQFPLLHSAAVSHPWKDCLPLEQSFYYTLEGSALQGAGPASWSPLTTRPWTMGCWCFKAITPCYSHVVSVWAWIVLALVFLHPVARTISHNLKARVLLHLPLPKQLPPKTETCLPTN